MGSKYWRTARGVTLGEGLKSLPVEPSFVWTNCAVV
jgi:hypothetical protein